MTEFQPRGVYPALPTAIDDDGSINYEAQQNHVEYVEEGGVQGLVPGGCTGHAAALGDRGEEPYEEHVEFVSRVAEMTSEDTEIIAGDGMNTFEQTLELASRVEDEADIDAHMMISPYVNCPPEDMIVNHYQNLAEELDEPIIAYNVPGRTGRNIGVATAIEIAEIDGIVGLKEASLDYEQIHGIGMELQSRGIDDFSLGSGDDSASHYVFQQGGDFAISVAANVHPEAAVEVWEEGVENDDATASYERNQDLKPLHEAMFQEGEKNPISVQYALNRMGFDFGTPRAPLDRFPRQDDEFQNRDEIDQVLEEFGLLEDEEL